MVQALKNCLRYLNLENPIAAKIEILKWALFNLCIYNSDAHGKNFTFLCKNSGLIPAPFYDLVNVKMYPEFEQDLAMSIVEMSLTQMQLMFIS